MVLEEETVEFRCQVQGDPQPNVRWRKDDIDVPRGRYAHLQEYPQNRAYFQIEKFQKDSDKKMTHCSKQLPILFYIMCVYV